MPPRTNVRVSFDRRKLSRLTGAVAAAAINASVEAVAKESQRLVPVDTGALKKSMKVTRADGRNPPEKQRGQVRYGGVSRKTRNNPDGRVRYAAAVHVRHFPWLRRAMVAVSRKRAALAKDVRRAFDTFR